MEPHIDIVQCSCWKSLRVLPLTALAAAPRRTDATNSEQCMSHVGPWDGVVASPVII